MLTTLLFIVVLIVLIVVHEFGHFMVAKWSGMKVEEFGLGYPPRAMVLGKIGETEYTLNWIPFGGFVKIYGEDGIADEDKRPHDSPRAFGARPRILQALVLLAGIAMNLIFAYVLITLTLMLGTPQALDDSQIPQARDVSIVAAQVVAGTPSAQAGLIPGDFIQSASYAGSTYTGHDTQAFTAFVGKDTTLAPIALSITRGGKPMTLTATPRAGVVPSDPTRPALGIAVATVGVIPVSILHAPVQGAILTWEIIKETAVGLAQFFGGIFTFHANLSQVSGPVGIAGSVGDAAHQGLAALLTITALISVNLALINVIPIPALDGGRLLFVIIEAIIRRPIKASVAAAINFISFGLLILLMLAVTAHDVFKLFA